MSGAHRLHPGSMLAGQYEIESVLGAGGTAIVYAATDVSLDRPVALKVLSDELSQQPEFISRFFREAKTMARFEHPNIVPIYAVARFESLHFIVMRRLEGMPLSSMLKRKGKVSLSEAVGICVQLCDALGHLHQSGFVHRDVKPSNIFIDARSHVTLLDMGITRHVAQSMTQPSMVVGSFQYMAPEQALSPSEVDERVDVYALGLVLFELITGTPAVALHQAPMAMVRAHLEKPLVDSAVVSHLPSAVASVLRKAVNRHRDGRYQSVREFKKALLQLRGESDQPETQKMKTLGDETILVRDGVATDAFPELQATPKVLVHSVPSPATIKLVEAVQRKTEPNGVIPVSFAASSKRTEPFVIATTKTRTWLVVGLLAVVALSAFSVWFAFLKS